MKAKKCLSQHFLIDPNVIKKFITTADLQPGEIVLEIGPGTGAITRELLAKGVFVFAVEKDAFLAKRLPLHPRLEVIEADILDLSLDFLPGIAKIVANLPFQITTPFTLKFAPLYERFTSLTLIVQEELAHRYTQEASFISLFLEFYAHVKILFKIDARAFFPSPQINGTVMQLHPHPPLLAEEEAFCTFLRQAFSQKRKMLRNTLKGTQVAEALKHLNIRSDARAEQLSLKQFIALFESIHETPRRLSAFANSSENN